MLLVREEYLLWSGYDGTRCTLRKALIGLSDCLTERERELSGTAQLGKVCCASCEERGSLYRLVSDE
jgi:hypothetical protein